MSNFRGPFLFHYGAGLKNEYDLRHIARSDNARQREEARRIAANIAKLPELFAVSLSRALSTRPSWRQVRNALYGFLLFAGAVAVVIAFSFLALNYLPGPAWFWFLVGFAGLFGMVFLIHQKFDSSRI